MVKLDEARMANDLSNLIRVAKENIKPAAATLAKAFQDYPMTVYFMPDETKRKKKQPGVFEDVLRAAIVQGEVYATSPEMEGVVIWQFVDKKGPVQKHQRTFRQLIDALFADKETRRRRKAFFDYSNQARARLMPDLFWYLQILGVDPAYQGKGFSSRLLKPMLARADREGLPCFLETQLEKNVALYRHFGFRVGEEGLIPGTNVYSWAMVRDAKK
jgi:GNAT superfamily N-acetyltransferase